MEKDYSESEETRELMYMAEWMFQNGKTSADWDNLPICDVKLMCAYISVKHRREINIISAGVGGALFGRKRK